MNKNQNQPAVHSATVDNDNTGAKKPKNYSDLLKSNKIRSTKTMTRKSYADMY